MTSNLAIVALCACVVAACGGYATRLQEVRVDVQNDRLDEALLGVDDMILRAEAGEAPEKHDLPLLLLERSAIRQGVLDHRGAVADLTQADPMLEVLDLTPDNAGSAARYLFSDDATLYRPPIYEKMMVNVSALASFLAQGNVRSAMVEARRIGTLLTFFEGGELANHPMLGAAAYMAGLAMEIGGDESAALRFYRDAYERGDAPGLAASLVRLSVGTPLANDPEVLRARGALKIGPDDEVPPRPETELVTIVFHGLAPYRRPERLPVGIVFAYMRQEVAYSLGERDQAAYNRILAEGLLTWVNFPVLVTQPNPLQRFDVRYEGQETSARPVADIESFALAQWADDRAGVAWSAITRAITRVVAREAVQAVGNAAGGAGETIGFLAGLATQGAMQAADTPDTRTWTFMPAGISIARQRVAPGEGTLRVLARGSGISMERFAPVTVREGTTSVALVRFFD